MRFRDLEVGQIFYFVGTGYGPCKKIVARQYVEAQLEEHRKLRGRGI